MEAHLFRYHRKAVLCFYSSHDEFNKLNEFLNSDYGSYDYGFSKNIKLRKDNGFYYIALEILDKSPDNVRHLKNGFRKSFGIELSVGDVERGETDIRKLLDSCVDKIVEKHK